MLIRRRFLENLVNFIVLNLLVVAGAVMANGQTTANVATAPAAERPAVANLGNSREEQPASKLEEKAKPVAEKGGPISAPPQITPPCRRTINANVVVCHNRLC